MDKITRNVLIADTVARQSDDGLWHLMNKQEGGWAEKSYGPFRTLEEIEQKWLVRCDRMPEDDDHGLYVQVYRLPKDLMPQPLYTTAPEAYDGFGTRTLKVAGRKDDKVFRLVETPLRHLEWQKMRYGSGMHAALDEKQFQEWIEYGFVVVEEEAVGR